MQESRKIDFGFAAEACGALGIVMLLTMALVSAEAYLSSGKMIASAEIENNCAPCSASIALAAR